MEEALGSGGTLLVHCNDGVSRSAAFVIYFLMRKMDLNFESARDFVASKRPIIRPKYVKISIVYLLTWLASFSPGFMQQLQFVGSQFYKLINEGSIEDHFQYWLAHQNGNVMLSFAWQSPEVVLYHSFETEKAAHRETQKLLQASLQEIQERKENLRALTEKVTVFFE